MPQSTALLLDAMEGEIRAEPTVKRADLLRLVEPPALSPVHLQVHRNYAFELIGSVLAPFLWLSRLKPIASYGDYDDSLTFAQIDPAAVQIISLDFERYGEKARSESFSEWFAGRIRNLRSRVEAPIIVSDWPSEELEAKRFNLELEKIADELPLVFIWETAEVFRSMNGRFFDERAAGCKGNPFKQRRMYRDGAKPWPRSFAQRSASAH